MLIKLLKLNKAYIFIFIRHLVKVEENGMSKERKAAKKPLL